MGRAQTPAGSLLQRVNGLHSKAGRFPRPPGPPVAQWYVVWQSVSDFISWPSQRRPMSGT